MTGENPRMIFLHYYGRGKALSLAEGVKAAIDNSLTMGELCSFDAFLKKYQLNEPELRYLALIVRGADTDRHDLTPESGGLFAISLGLSDMRPSDDQAVPRDGFIVYDAFYQWLKLWPRENTSSMVAELTRFVRGGNLITAEVALRNTGSLPAKFSCDGWQLTDERTGGRSSTNLFGGAAFVRLLSSILRRTSFALVRSESFRSDLLIQPELKLRTIVRS
jgi:hypothetical protein